MIIHEYGHAIQDDQVRGFGRSFEALVMGEGFGDYLAGVMSVEGSPGTTLEQNMCLAEWWSRGFFDNCLRRLDGNDTVQEATFECDGEIHCVGEAWSGALWDLRTSLGDDGLGHAIMDRVVIASHEFLLKDAFFDEAAEALLDADDDLYAGAHASAIEDVMEDRGFL